MAENFHRIYFMVRFYTKFVHFLVYNVSNKAFWVIASQFKEFSAAKSNLPVSTEVRSLLRSHVCSWKSSCL